MYGTFENKKLKICKICIDEIKDNEEICTIDNCGHIYHKDCLKHYIESKINSLSSKIVCPEINDKVCGNVLHDYTIKEVIKSKSLFDKYNFNKIKNNPEYRICPYCGDSYCKYDYLKKWIKKCPNCKKESCFNCGVKHSKNSECYDIGRETMVEMAKYYRNYNVVVKRCPHCNLLQEKMSGCNDFICGGNYDEPNKIKKKGCGKKFDWKNAKEENFGNVEFETPRQTNFIFKESSCFGNILLKCVYPCIYPCIRCYTVCINAC